MGSRYALIIGSTTYSDPALARLTAPGKDAEALARVLRSKDICAFDDVEMLLDQPEATVREAIEGFFDEKRPDDLLVLYFSGHGVRDEYGSLYLAVRNTNRLRLRSTAIESDFIRTSMDQSRSRRQVLILDCCNSGAFAPGTKAVTGGSVGTASAFEGTGYGHVVLTASDSTQFAWEGDKVIGDTEQSLFTYFLVKGLEGEADRDGDGRITVDELYDYAYEQIVGITPKQTPSKWSYKEQGEIVLRQNMPLASIKLVALPEDLIDNMDSPFDYVRKGTIEPLARLLNGRNRGLALSARQALERLAADDDNLGVRKAAAQAIEPIRQRELEQQTEEQRKAIESTKEAAPLATEKAEAELAASAEAGRGPVIREPQKAPPIQAREEAQRPVAQQAGAKAVAKEQPRVIGTVKELTRQPGWRAVLWIIMGWAIGWVIAAFLSPIVSLSVIILFATGGVVSAIALRIENVLSDRNGMLWMILGWTASASLIFWIGSAFGLGLGAAFDYWAIVGAAAGLSTAFVLRSRGLVSNWQGMLWITLGWALGVGIGVTIAQAFPTTPYIFMVAGAIAGAIGGTIMIWRLRRTKK